MIMGLLADIKIDNLGTIFTGIGQLGKDIRTAITGKEPIDSTKAAELALMAQELTNKVELAQMEIQKTQLSIAVAESQSTDKWTSRGRPSFLYVMYLMILAAIPVGILHAFDPEMSANIAIGMGNWLKAIPTEMWWLFGAGYLGYTGARGLEKMKGSTK
jgi:hypothetical protein